MKDKTALITGGTGFIGENLAKKLADDGWLVNLLCRNKQNRSECLGSAGTINVYEYDGHCESIIDAFSQAQPSIVFHLAAYFAAEHQIEDVEKLISSNLVFGSQLLEVMARTNVRNLVNTGTSWEHYNNCAYNPVNLYAATKQAFEKIIDYYVEAREFKVYTLKLFDTYGNGDCRGKLIDHVISSIYNRTPLSFSPGDQLIDIVHVNDVVRAYKQAAISLENEPIPVHKKFGVSSKNPIPLKDLVSLIQKLMNDSTKVEWGGRSYRDREVMQPWTKFNCLDDWEPTVNLEKGLADLIEIKKK